MFLHLRSIASVLLLVALAGCALSPSRQKLAMPRPARAAIVAYELSGRISVRQGEQRYVANIWWRHDLGNDKILLTTPFGQGIAELRRDATGAHLLTSDRREFAGPDWQTLSVKVFGFALPLTSLPRWVLGDAPAGAKRDAAGRTQQFSDDGWRVDYREYEGPGTDALPQLIDLARGDIAIRLKIDDWAAVR
ncbi:outer-membrane lipoprotein LolB precursor [mine drainage metagenome]|uniref:Outer-membrane lipoprotein LolB n=1 Tax=mine drainage metagenome TaxID=410659 RepID=A0A1J5SEI5_9ZZZZ